MSGTDVGGISETNTEPVMALRVFASGSGGNCSALILREDAARRLCLVDLGLSPRASGRHLADAGLALSDVEHVFITHFDSDHCRATWPGRLPRGAVVHVHPRHVRAARAAGLGAVEPIDGATTVGEARVHATLLAHDRAGVAAFRFDLADASVGYATDVGRPTARLVDLFAGVDLLALESNYCPRLQAASNRPAFLKERIMGGAGHLSNQQCAATAARIGPRRDLVLLHLSRQCNTPALALAAHEGAAYSVTVSAQDHATRWIPVAPFERAPANAPAVGVRAHECA